MPFIGAVPAQKYISLAKQDFTTIAGTGYTLDQSVTNEVDIALFINHVRQEPTTAYTASGTTLTLTSATTTSDDMYCVFLAKATETVNPPDGSVGTAQLEASAVTNAKVASDAAIATTKLGAGAVLQAATATDTGERTTTSTSFVTASNTLSVAITPSSTSNKILVMVSTATGNNTAGAHCYSTIYRGTTNLGGSNGMNTQYQGGTGEHYGSTHMSILDSPSTTSSTTYQVYIRASSGTAKMNSSGVTGTITVMEIAG